MLNASLEQYFSVIQPCDQPCQDVANCDPLEFTFEVAPAKIKMGRPYFLWYRARLKNRTCRLLEAVSVDGFLDSKELSKEASHLWVSVSGPDGRLVDRLPIPGPDGGISWDYGSTKGVSISTKGTIYPYQPNFKVIDQLRNSKKLREFGSIGLAPGETFETITPILRPYRIVAWSIQGEDGGFGDGYRWVPVENPPRFPMPPERFNFLDRYTFKRPGRYTISAGFVDEVYIYPIYSRWDKLSPWLQSLLRSAHPETWKPKARKVNLAASPAFIEVSR